MGYTTTSPVGCAVCWPSDATDAAKAGEFRPVESRLISESHFDVSIRRCTACSQRFLAVFTETIDYAGGDDAQYLTVVPLTEVEVSGLLALGSAVTAEQLDSLGVGRRWLADDHPTGGPTRHGWGSGFFVGPYS